jgi:hypothetical protein
MFGDWLDDIFSSIDRSINQCFDAIEREYDNGLDKIRDNTDDTFREIEKLSKNLSYDLLSRTKELLSAVGNEYRIAYRKIKSDKEKRKLDSEKRKKEDSIIRSKQNIERKIKSKIERKKIKRC